MNTIHILLYANGIYVKKEPGKRLTGGRGKNINLPSIATEQACSQGVSKSHLVRLALAGCFSEVSNRPHPHIANVGSRAGFSFGGARCKCDICSPPPHTHTAL